MKGMLKFFGKPWPKHKFKPFKKMMKNCFLTFILRSGLHRNENPLNPNLIQDLVNNFKTTF